MENPMMKIRVEKVTVNVGMGDNIQKVENAKKLIERITERKVVITRSKRRSTFGVTRGRPIGVKVVMRGEHAMKFLKRTLETVEKLKASQFDAQGNFSFGIPEYIDIPGVKYDPSIGIMGLEVTVTVERPGYGVARRRLKSKVGKKHVITKEQAVEWAKQTLGVPVE
ncbi:MAG: 50S ribosomal protein L5 [Candidatus Aenigmatarchaeota archaeon]